MFIKLFYKPFVCLYREMVATALNAVDCCLLAEIQIESNQITSYKMIVTVFCLRFKRLRTEYRKKSQRVSSVYTQISKAQQPLKEMVMYRYFALQGFKPVKMFKAVYLAKYIRQRIDKIITNIFLWFVWARSSLRHMHENMP